MSNPDGNNNKQHEKKEGEGCVDEKREEGIGQGELYSPQYAVKIPHNQHKPAASPSSVKRRVGMVKDRLLVKLAAATDGRQNSHQLDKAKSFIETVVREVSVAAQGMQRIKSHLADVFPYLSPSLSSKMVDDAEKEAEDEDESEQHQQTMSKL